MTVPVAAPGTPAIICTPVYGVAGAPAMMPAGAAVVPPKSQKWRVSVSSNKY